MKTHYHLLASHQEPEGPGTLSSTRPVIRKNEYRPDLHMTAIHKASTILRSQKLLMVKRK